MEEPVSTCIESNKRGGGIYQTAWENWKLEAYAARMLSLLLPMIGHPDVRMCSRESVSISQWCARTFIARSIIIV